MRFKIDMKPMSTALPGKGCCLPYQTRSDSPSPPVMAHAEVKEERMNASVPSDIHEADQGFSLIGAHVSEAPAENFREGDRRRVAPGIMPKVFQRRIGGVGISSQLYCQDQHSHMKVQDREK
jgi:hypothetical protein